MPERHHRDEIDSRIDIVHHSDRPINNIRHVCNLSSSHFVMPARFCNKQISTRL
jgi:hypothetical protein